jgi:hypothetical protein
MIVRLQIRNWVMGKAHIGRESYLLQRFWAM